jgi:hypothetical protein
MHRNLHGAEGNVDRGASHLDCDDRVKSADSSLERFEMAVLIREYAILPSLDTEAHAGVDVFCRRLEPSVALRLQNR